MTALEVDRGLMSDTSIADLEAEIDDVVYDIFGLNADEQAVIEEHMEVF